MNEELGKVNLFGKEVDKYLLIVLIIAVLSFAIQVYFVSQIKFIGTSDPAHYAEAAENVIKGKGFSLDYLNEYFLKFNTISHPEEYGFPGVSIILIPFILLLGKTAFAVKLPSMIIGTILFPILIYYLGKEFFNQRTGLLAAVSFLFYPAIFPMSFGGERDIMFAFFVVSSIYFFYKGVKEDNEMWFLIMGALLGFSYLVRQASIAIIPAIFFAHYLINRRISLKFLQGFVVAGLIVAPWLMRSYLIFGDPFFTVNKYAGWILGYAPLFEQQYFKIYWGLPKPGLFTMINNMGGGATAFLYTFRLFTGIYSQIANSVVITLLAFAGVIFASAKDITKKRSRLLSILAFFLILGVVYNHFPFINVQYNLLYQRAFVSIFYLGILIALLLYFRGASKENTIFLLSFSFYAIFFSVLWSGGIRYWVTMVPFLLIYAWYGLEILITKIAERIIRPPPSSKQIIKILLVFFMAFLIFAMPQTYGKFLDKDSGFPFHDDNTSIQRMKVAEKIKNLTSEDAVIMGCDVGVMHFYSERKFLEFPSGGTPEIGYLMQLYNASYFSLLGCERRSIDIDFYASVFKGNLLLKDANYGPNAAKFSLPSGYKNMVFKVAFANGTVGNETAVNMSLEVY